MTGAENQKKASENSSPDGGKKVLGFMLFEAGIEFALLIGAPLAVFIWAGQKLDARYHMNFFVIAAIFAALAFSSAAIWIRIKAYKKILNKK